MGNSNELISSQLKFIQTIQDARFGEIDIFQNDEGRFLMKAVKTHISGDRRHNEFIRILEWVQKQAHKMVVPILTTTNKHQKNICVQYQITTLYMEYYNYTLKDLVNSHKHLDEAQLWFVLVKMLGLVIELRKHKIGINLEIDNVFLTLKGHPTVYAHHLLSFQDTICVSNYGMGQLIAKLILQLANLQLLECKDEQEEKELLGPLAKLCSKYKVMGRMVRQLLYRERPQSQILDQILLMIDSNKLKKANEIKLIKFKYMIPEKREEKAVKSTAKEVLDHAIGTVNIGKKKFEMQSAKLPSHGQAVQEKQEAQPLNKKSINKQAVDKMLADISEKKKMNLEKMQRFQQKKDEVILNSVRNQQLVQSLVRKREGKENTGLMKNNMRRSEKKGKGQKEKERFAQDLLEHSHLR